MKIAVLVTCHNRSEITLRGIASLVHALTEIDDVSYELVVVDDGSTDGTATSIARLFPKAVLDTGDGSLFWNGGMRRAFQVAQLHGPYDGYLLFNDDVVVDAGSLAKFIDEYRSLNAQRPAILAAATANFSEGISYSGFLRGCKFRPLLLHKMQVVGVIQKCDTFNGNFVMLPAPFFEEVGGLDRRYIHGYGDIDLGYVAKAAGVQPYLASCTIGQCAANEPSDGQGTSRASRLIRGTWVKRDSLSQRLHFLRKHSPFSVLFLSVPLTIARFTVNRLLEFAHARKRGG